MSHFFGSRDHDVIVERSQHRGLSTERLPDLAFNSIAFHRHPTSFERNPKTEVLQLIGNTKDSTLRKPEDLASVKKTPILPRIVEASFWAERLRPRITRSRNELLTGDRNGEAFAALGAATLQDGAASGGLHALTETMTAAALGTARLECAFHKFKTLSN